MSKHKNSIIKTILDLILKNKNTHKLLSVSSSAINCIYAGLSLRDYFASSTEISEHEVYSLEEAAKLMKIHPLEIHNLIESGEVAGKRIGVSYRILGRSLLEYLSQKNT